MKEAEAGGGGQGTAGGKQGTGGACLVFIGRSPAAGGQSGSELRWEGEVVVAGAVLPLRRRRSPWNPRRREERVIVGSHPARADVLLAGEGIFPEHVRLYLPGRDAAADLLAIHPGSTRCGGASVEPREWVALQGGEEIEMGPWRFRFERGGG